MLRSLVTLLALLGATGCEKGLGDECDEPADCRKGLACLGDAVKTCQICSKSEACKKEGLCEPLAGRCVRKPDPYRDNKEGGCPCGCDHSGELAAELEELGGGAALARIDETLAIIAEREEAGFVTEAMVVHRLRMLDLATKLGRSTSFSRALSSETVGARAARGELPVTAGDGLRVRAELMAHGEKTEVIRGKPKLQRACFRLWMEIENTTPETRILARPTLEAELPLPVSRWYVEDSEGSEWDGSLGPHEKRSLLVIGYVAEPIGAGTEIQALLRLQALAVPLSALARDRWYEAL